MYVLPEICASVCLQPGALERQQAGMLEAVVFVIVNIDLNPNNLFE